MTKKYWIHRTEKIQFNNFKNLSSLLLTWIVAVDDDDDLPVSSYCSSPSVTSSSRVPFTWLKHHWMSLFPANKYNSGCWHKSEPSLVTNPPDPPAQMPVKVLPCISQNRGPGAAASPCCTLYLRGWPCCRCLGLGTARDVRGVQA